MTSPLPHFISTALRKKLSAKPRRCTSSRRCFLHMQITTAMVILMIGWCVVTLLVKGGQRVPFPTPENLHFSTESLGLVKGMRWLVNQGNDTWGLSSTAPSLIGLFGVLMAFGHCVL